MKRKAIRALSMLLCVLLCAAILPLTALAVSEPETEAAEEIAPVRIAAKSAMPTAKLAAVSNGKPKITTQPKSQSVMQSKTITLKVAAKGSGLKYQWYYRKSASGSWKKMSGKTSAALKITVGRYNGWQYRCKVSNKSGSVTSKAATLTVNYITYRALLICQSYAGVPDLETLPGDNDRDYMLRLLYYAKCPGGGKYETYYMIDASRHEILESIDSLLGEADSNDVSLFYFTGHGDSATPGSSPHAGSLATVEKEGSAGWGRRYWDILPVDMLADHLGQVKGKVIVMLDSCGSGAAIYTNGQPTSDHTFDPDAFNYSVINAFSAVDETIIDNTVSNTGELRSSKFVVLTACGLQEKSHYHGTGDDRVSNFTYWLCHGAEANDNRVMLADSNKNHVLTVTELYKYIKKHDYSDQHVQMYSSDASYPLFKS